MTKEEKEKLEFRLVRLECLIFDHYENGCYRLARLFEKEADKLRKRLQFIQNSKLFN